MIPPEDEYNIQRAAEELRMNGCGMVMVYGVMTDELTVKCFSTIPQSEVKIVLTTFASNTSLMPYDMASIVKGDFIVKCDDELIDQQCLLAAKIVNRNTPMVVAAVAEGRFSVYGIGQSPILIYMAIRVIACMSEPPKGEFDPFNAELN